MKDILGAEVEVGDVIVSVSGQGHRKVGKVYGFTADGRALIECERSRRDSTQGKYTKQWSRVSSGWSVVVIGREKLGLMQPTDETWNAINREYPGDSARVG